MSKATKCYYCHHLIIVDDDYYGYTNCEKCSCQISFYNPTDYEPLTEEERDKIE